MRRVILSIVIGAGFLLPISVWSEQAQTPAPTQSPAPAPVEKKPETQPAKPPEKKPQPPPPPPIKWFGTIEGNFRNTNEQIDTTNTTLKLDVRGEATSYRLYFGLLYLRGKTGDTLSSFQRRAEVKTDRKLTSKFYGYLQQVFDANQVTNLELGSRSSGGFGYHYVATNTVKASIDIGASYNSEEYSNLPLLQRTYSYQCSNNFYWKISNGLEFRHRYEYLPNTSDLKNFRSRSDGSLKIYIGKYLYSSFGIINEYDSAPASVTTPKHKATILTTIGFKF